MNFYAVLGVPQDAEEETIRRAYRILARRYHPDRGVGSSVEKFRQVTEAYETLIDSRSRHAYDLSLRWAESRVPVRVEPMVAQSVSFRQKDAGVHGPFRRAPRGAAFAPDYAFNMLFEELVDSLNDLFFGPASPW
jgi:DnaJ-class molecular chaperone